MHTLASKILSTPSSILLASSYLRTIPYIAIMTRELTDCIIQHSGIPWASKSCSIGGYRYRWARDYYNLKVKERKNIMAVIKISFVAPGNNLNKFCLGSLCIIKNLKAIFHL